MKHWSSHELKILERLREGFLSGRAGERDYWRGEEELALYDATYGERIGWKWDAALGELKERGWRPESRHVVDWGCGTGIAGRRVIDAWPGRFTSLALHDRSPLAVQFAARRAEATCAGVEVKRADLKAPLPPGTLLVLSHVVNELKPEDSAKLLALASQAHEIIWVEAGTHPDSRRLTTEMRERLREQFAAIAPCTHSAKCGMLATRNQRHWCHFFAPVPPSAFQDAKWAEFAREVGIDLRSLPYSYIALERPRATPVVPPGYSRVIGEPREFKGHAKVLSCQANGVAEFTLQKRDDPELFRLLRDAQRPQTHAWKLENGRILGTTPLPYSADSGNSSGNPVS
jgi:ribosomal protein RSM22 (predicted rRNA methylase)